MSDSNRLKDLTVDIVIGGIGAGGETLSNLTQKALLASFKAAANLDDLAETGNTNSSGRCHRGQGRVSPRL